MTKRINTFLLLLTLTLAGVFLSQQVSSANWTTSKAITFSKDVAPIIYKNCVSCHRPGEVAPMSLITYRDVRPWAGKIRERVVARAMPPWTRSAEPCRPVASASTPSWSAGVWPGRVSTPAN